MLQSPECGSNPWQSLKVCEAKTEMKGERDKPMIIVRDFSTTLLGIDSR